MDEDVDGLIWSFRVAMTLERLDEARSLMKRLSTLMALPGATRSSRFHVALDSATLSRFTGDLAGAKRFGAVMQAASTDSPAERFFLEWNKLRQASLEGNSPTAAQAAHALLNSAALPQLGRARSALAVAEYAAALAKAGFARRAIALYDAAAECLMEEGGYGAWVALYMYLKALLLVECARACEERHEGNLDHEAMGALKSRVYWTAASRALDHAASELTSTEDGGMMSRSIAAVQLVIPEANASPEQAIAAMHGLTSSYGEHHILDTFVLIACETARIQSAQGNHESAVRSLLNARSMMPLTGYETFKSKIEFHESLVYSRQGRSRQALLSYQRYAQRTLSRHANMDEGFRDESLDIKSRNLFGSAEKHYSLGQSTGQQAAPKRIGTPAVSSVDSMALTPREQQVIGLVKQGMSNKQVANLLDMSSNTVRNHMTAILKKSGLSGRQQASDLRHPAGPPSATSDSQDRRTPPDGNRPDAASG